MRIIDLDRSEKASFIRPLCLLRSVRLALWVRVCALVLAFGLPWLAPTAMAQTQSQTQAQPQTQPSTESSEKTWGAYAVTQSGEFGYRDSLINGNMNNYDTFENLASGWRLFDYTVSMRSNDHKGILFDNLFFSNFGYGGDPNDVSRLRIEKNKWYDFQGLFRRDKNLWNYDLLANPLNTNAAIPGSAITSSPHLLDLSRRMQDYDLTLLPQSRLRFRLGYSRNTNQGPASTTLDGGTEPVLSQLVKYTTNAYRIGVDYRGIAKTTLSFDEFLTYSKVDNTTTDTNFRYQLANGTPVDLGIVYIGTSPCASPITNPATTPPTVTSNCNGYLSYSLYQNPRSNFPTEHFAFQSTYIKKLSMTGSIGYSTADDKLTGLNEFNSSWTTRTFTRGDTSAGPADAKRVSVNADWSGDYELTSKLSLLDEFSYANWRIPGYWLAAETNLFPIPATSGQTGMALPIANFTPANFATVCPTVPYNGPNCPQHAAPSGSSTTSGSGADVTNELFSQFLGQNLRSNTVELKYDFSRRVSAHVGYLYTARNIQDFSAIWDTGEIYFPGGNGGTAGLLQGGTATGNYYLAARGDCAVAAGALPAPCKLNGNGSIQEGLPTSLVAEAGNDTGRNQYDIHEHAALLGISTRPTDQLRFGADLMFGYNDNSFTRISPRQLQSYKIQASYTPVSWASINGAVDIHENRDDVFQVNNLEHGRNYSFGTTLIPNAKLAVDFGYSYMDIFTQTSICFPDTGSTVFTTACPIAGSPSPLGTLSVYASKDHYAYGNVMWKPYKRVTAMLGYSGTIVRGNTTLLSVYSPTGTLDFNFLKPTASLAFDIYKGVTYKTAWNYYGYNDHGVANPAGLVALPLQDFNGSNITFSIRYAF